jgi:hypothetical protein
MPENEDIKELGKELKKLKPKARLKKLRELEEKRKAEINDIDELIKDSEKELKTDEVAEEVTPEQTEINIGRLFEEGEQLERTVKKDAPETSESEDRGYNAFKQVYNDYSKLQDIAYSSMMGPLTSSQMNAVDKIGERLENIKYQSASEEVSNMLVASKAALYKIRKYAGIE